MSAWCRIQSAIYVVPADLQSLGNALEEGVESRPPLFLGREGHGKGIERDLKDVRLVVVGKGSGLKRASAILVTQQVRVLGRHLGGDGGAPATPIADPVAVPVGPLRDGDE